jgi:hypothetical protein
LQRYIEVTKAEGAKLLAGGGRPKGERFAKVNTGSFTYAIDVA